MHTKRRESAIGERSAIRWVMAGALPVALSLMLVACTPSPATTSSPTVAETPTSTPSATNTPTAVAGQLNPDGAAVDNQPFFDSVNQTLIATNPAAGGMEFTSNLRTNGFDIAAMQVTPDTTTVGVAADSIQFSVRWKDECLIGQYGQGQYKSIVAPVLGTGTCLIGQTRPIDW